MLKDYFLLAYKSTKQRKVRSWLTMLGIILGIATVVALISLSQGLKTAVAENFLQLGSDKLVIQAAGGGFGPPGMGVPVHLTEDDKKVIESTQGVDLALGRLIRTVQLEFNDETKYSFAVTVPKDLEERKLAIEANNYEVELGKFIERDAAFHAVIGHDTALDLFDKEIQLRDQINIQGYDFKVVGILKKSGNPQQDSTLVLPDGALRTILGLGNEFDIIPLRVESGEDLNLVADDIAKKLRKHRNVEEGKEDFTIETPQQILAILDNILLAVQGVLIGIAAISLVVGSIGIMNTMYTAVLERTREVGVLKAVGARRRDIMTLFLFESGLLGSLGGLIGIIIGVSLSKSVEIVSAAVYGTVLIRANISIPFLIGMLIFAFAVGAISGTFPARQASKLTVVEALRK